MKQVDKLYAKYSKTERDIILHWPCGVGTKADAHWLSYIFDDNFIREMQKRGYDITTMKFSIEPQNNNEKFLSERPSPV